MADDVLSQLGGFALGEVLNSLDLGLEIEGAKRSLGVSSTSAFSRDSIYAGKFVDDVDDDGEAQYDPVTDLEAQVDNEMYNEKYKKAGLKAVQQKKTLMRGEEDDFDDDDDEEEDETLADDAAVTRNGGNEMGGGEEEEVYRAQSADPIPLPPMKQINVKQLFPQFQYNKVLNFTDLFTARPRKKPRKDYESTKLTLPALQELRHSKSTRDTLLAPLKPITRDARIRSLFTEFQGQIDEQWSGKRKEDDDDMLDTVEAGVGYHSGLMEEATNAFELPELDDWESRIIWDAKPSAPVPALSADLLAPRNSQFEQGGWLKSIIWDSNTPYKEYTRLNLNLNDTQMVLEVQAAVPEVVKTNPTIQIAAREAGLDPFNLSNDRAYEVAKETKKRIRQTFGILEVQHAYPAQKLQLPFYKTRLSKDDARSFHRPALRFPANVQLTFTKTRSKKKKDKQGRKIKKSDGEAIRTTSDVSLRDTSTFCLWEFSEENPPIISNLGMGSILVNYYRRRDTTDDFVPQLDIGEPLLLELSDESPFKQFGVVDPGQTVPALYNNLIRAPLFRQQPYHTDFLAIRSTIAGETKYYIRNIKNAFVVGQTYPLQEVPGPHSRKNTNLTKLRLQAIAFRLLNKKPNHMRLKVSQLTKYFPDQNDLQMRQRLKDFMEFNRKEPDQGYWTLKKNFVIPDDSEFMKLATPELVCLTESMQVGQRHLQDAGYGQVEEGGTGDDDSVLDIEQQLAPWITTKNFLNAISNKAMLKLFGEGDPTGRGEAFSFLRVSMKDIFLRDGELMSTRLATMENRPKSAHRYNVQEQQDVYREEIARIWKTQHASLSNPIEPVLTHEDEERQRGSRYQRGGSQMDDGASNIGSPRDNASRASSPADDMMSNASGRAGGQNKVLRIKRLFAGKWRVEIVRDPTIISAYLRQRTLIEEDAMDPDELMPTDDATKNERRKKRLQDQVDKLKRNQERRVTRKNRAAGIVGGPMIGVPKPAKPETTRVCGNCGQRGHMKTSRKLCPRWAEFNAGVPGVLSSGPGLVPSIPSLAVATTTSASPFTMPMVMLPRATSPPSAPRPTLKFTLGAPKASTAALPGSPLAVVDPPLSAVAVSDMFPMVVDAAPVPADVPMEIISEVL